MSMRFDQFGAKPAVLRCSRCGKFVDWEDAQVQIVCTCRPHLELPPVLVREATDADRAAARAPGFGRHPFLVSRLRSSLLHRGRRGARLARREE